MDTESFVAALNDDLETEYQSIVQYINHVATISGAEFLGVIDELKIHLQQELSHAQILAGQISFLGGVPTTSRSRQWRSRATVGPRSLPTSSWRLASWSAIGRGSPRPTSSAWPTWRRPYGPYSSRPRSTCGTYRPPSATSVRTRPAGQAEPASVDGGRSTSSGRAAGPHPMRRSGDRSTSK